MKILFQCLYGSGGALANLGKLIESIAENFPDCRFVVLCSPESGFEKLAERPNIELERYGEERRRVMWRLLLGWRGLRDAARKHTPDVVWSINTGAFTPLPYPQILQINNAYQVYPLSMARYHPRGRFAVFILQFLCRLTARRASLLVCQTHTIADQARPRLGYRGEIKVIGKAVGDTISQPDRNSSSNDASRPFRFGYVAAHYPHKNHRVLLDAAALLAEDLRFELHLTLTPSEIVEIGGRRAAELIERGVIMPHGWVATANLPGFYGMLDACVMPSVLESLSSSHLEAMCFRKPQIVADRPYAHELCGGAALYADPADPADWAAKMAGAANDPRLRHQLVREGSTRFEELPQSWADVAWEWHGVLKHVFEAEGES